MKKCLAFILLISSTFHLKGQDSASFRNISDQIMLRGRCYEDLRFLCKNIGHRLSGSKAADKAVDWAQKTLTEAGADLVWQQPVEVPYWVRGRESLAFKFPGQKDPRSVPVLSLGNSIGTDGKTLEATVVLVNSFDEFAKLSKEEVMGKIIFFNHRFPQQLINTFEGYGEAGPYRWIGPNVAAAKEAAGVIIRSVSSGEDDFPHTGSFRYADTVKPIPAVAIGNKSADLLENECKKGKVRAQLVSNCKMVGTKTSYNVIGELRGSQYPDQYVVVGGHLDSWDVGEGAHDDGAGVVQSIEVLRTFKQLGIRPKRTLRVVLFMNEENGLKGGVAYNDSAKAKKEKHILAMESDAGGFSPRGIGLVMGWKEQQFIKRYRNLFLPYGVYDFEHEEGGADISPLRKSGVPVAGLMPDPQRYFDYHHTNADVFEAVNHRELKVGAVVMTQFMYLVTELGLK
jgi:carboxypeptidase Q